MHHNHFKKAAFCILFFILFSLGCSTGYKIKNPNQKRPVEKDVKSLRLYKSSHPTLTYFKRLAKDKTFADGSSEFYGKDINLPVSNDLTGSSATIKVTPSEGIPNGGKVQMSWSGVSKPSNKDWIGFYCPKNDTVEHYLDYLLAAEISPTWDKGYGSTEVRVYNMRSECEFRY